MKIIKTELDEFEIYDFVCLNIYVYVIYIHVYVAFMFITLLSIFKATCF